MALIYFSYNSRRDDGNGSNDRQACQRHLTPTDHAYLSVSLRRTAEQAQARVQHDPPREERQRCQQGRGHEGHGSGGPQALYIHH